MLASNNQETIESQLKCRECSQLHQNMLALTSTINCCRMVGSEEEIEGKSENLFLFFHLKNVNLF